MIISNKTLKERIDQIIRNDSSFESYNKLFTNIEESENVTVKISKSSFDRTMDPSDSTVNMSVLIAFCQYYGVQINDFLSKNYAFKLHPQNERFPEKIYGYMNSPFNNVNGYNTFELDKSGEQKNNDIECRLTINLHKNEKLVLKGNYIYTADNSIFIDLISNEFSIVLFIPSKTATKLTNSNSRTDILQKKRLFEFASMFVSQYSDEHTFQKCILTTYRMSEKDFFKLRGFLKLSNTLSIDNEILITLASKYPRINKLLQQANDNGIISERKTTYFDLKSMYRLPVTKQVNSAVMMDLITDEYIKFHGLDQDYFSEYSNEVADIMANSESENKVSLKKDHIQKDLIDEIELAD